MNLGNNKDFLVRVVSQCLPYIGYPRSLNAVSVLDKCFNMNQWRNDNEHDHL